MNCPNCHEKTDYTLYETADDYQDGVVECLNCGETIATFNLTVLLDSELEE